MKTKQAMPRVIFTFDKEKDLFNNWETVNYESRWDKGVRFNQIPELEKICRGKSFEECKDEVEKFWSQVHNSVLIGNVRKAYQDSWNAINDEYFRRLEKVTGNKFPFRRITAYLTTQTRCPYNFKEGYFFCSIFSNIPRALLTSGHELMHLDFHNYDGKDVEKGIGKDKASDIKEALTVLLNFEFQDLWFVDDRGKSSSEQQELRDYIAQEWRKDRNYKKLLDKCIKYAKGKETR